MLFLLLACTGSGENSAGSLQSNDESFVVETLSFPASYLVQRLAGELVKEHCVLPTGEDPVSWNPSPDEIARVQKADLIVGNGAGFEGWVQTASLPTSKLILSADDLNLIHGEGKTHSHGKGGDHSHGEIDPHTWASPEIYKQQARVIHDALTQKLPSKKEDLAKNLKALEQDLEALDQEYKKVFEGLKTVPFAANHPSYTYLAREYKLSIQSFDFDPEMEMKLEGEGLVAFDTWREKTGASVLFWESEPNQSAKDSFSEEILHIYIDPLEQPAGKYDYLSQAKANIKRFQSIEVSSSKEKSLFPEEHGHPH